MLKFGEYKIEDGKFIQGFEFSMLDRYLPWELRNEISNHLISLSNKILFIGNVEYMETFNLGPEKRFVIQVSARYKNESELEEDRIKSFVKRLENVQ